MIRYEPGVRQLIDELIKIGQVKTPVNHYKINWIGAFEINPRDKVAAEFDLARTQHLRTNWMTINAIRAREEPSLGPIEGGDQILGLLRIQVRASELGQTRTIRVMAEAKEGSRYYRSLPIETAYARGLRETQDLTQFETWLTNT